MNMPATGFSNTVKQIKGLGILLVVLGHIASPLTPFIFSFHIPIFFFIAGLFIQPGEPVGVFFRKNATRLMVPYFIFAILGLAINLIKNILLHRPSENIFDSIWGLLFWMDARHLNHYGFVLWFLPTLFFSKTIIYYLNKYVPRHEAGIFLSCVAIAFFSSYFQVQLPFAIDNAMIALPWVSAGLIFHSHKEKLLGMPMLIPLVMAGILCLIIGAGFMPIIDMAENNIGHIWISLPYTFILFFLVFWVLYRMNIRPPSYLSISLNFFAFIGIQTMLIYVVHPYTNNGANLIVTHYLGDGYWYLQFLITCIFLALVMWIKSYRPNNPVFRFL